jgi:ribose transport system substrate-binding protein
MKRLVLVALIVCAVLSPAFSSGKQEVQKKETYKIGFLAFMMGQEWYKSIADGAQARAKELGIELIVADSNNDSTTQINAFENFIAQQVDAIIISPVDVKALVPVMNQAKAAGILVISESNSIDGAVTRVGSSDYESGFITGQWYGDYVKKNKIDPKILILGYKSLQNCRDRVDGFKAGMTDKGITYQVKTEVDGGFREASLNAATDAFTANPDINTVFGINDDSTLGAVAALKGANINPETFTAILYGLEGVAGRSALEGRGPYKAGLSMFPEFVGVACVDAAFAALNGESVPANYKTPTAVIESKDFSKFFIKEGNSYALNYETVRSLNK